MIELRAVQCAAARGDNLRSATPRQVGAVAGCLAHLMRNILRTEMGCSLGEEALRDLRIAFLNELFGETEYRNVRYGAGVSSANDLSFAEASALLDWLLAEDGTAYDILWRWLEGHAEIPHTESFW